MHCDEVTAPSLSAAFAAAPRAADTALPVTAIHAWCGAPAAREWAADAPAPWRTVADGRVVAFGTRRPDPPLVESFDVERGIELWGTEATFAAGDVRAQPAGTAIAAWLASNGCTTLHAGAVAVDGRGVLFVGRGGAGKSTTVMALCQHGATFVGDDFCAVEIGPPRVHSLFATCKLTDESAHHLDAGDLPPIGRTAVGKRVFAVAPSMTVSTSVPIHAMVVLQPPDAAPTAPVPLSSAAAARALRTTAIKAAAGAIDLSGWLTDVTALARSVPAFAISCTWDFARLADAVRAAVDA